jgi:hypothetical protein
MKKVRIATLVVVFALAYAGSAYAETGLLADLVPMASTTPSTKTNTNVEPMANNGNQLPLEQGVQLDSGSKVPVQGDAPVKEQPVPTQAVSAQATPKVVELTPAKVEKLPKTGDNPYTSSTTYISMLALGVAAIGYLVVSRRKKQQMNE